MTEPKGQTSMPSEAETGEQLDERFLLRWRKRNSYYYNWLDRIYKFVVRPGSRVLHVGCECGDILAAVAPSYGVGVDEDPQAIALKKTISTPEFLHNGPARVTPR